MCYPDNFAMRTVCNSIVDNRLIIYLVQTGELLLPSLLSSIKSIGRADFSVLLFYFRFDRLIVVGCDNDRSACGFNE